MDRSIYNMQQRIIESLMKMKQNEIIYDSKMGDVYKEVFDNPQYLNLPDTTQIEFGLQWARKLYQNEAANPSFEQYFKEVDLVRYFKDAIILDVGCYIGGKTVRWIEKYEGKEIYGIDVNPRFIQIANRFAEEKCVNAHFKVNFAEKMDFPNEFFNVIVSENTFEHVTDIREVMHECERILKKKGYLVILFPSFWGPYSHHLDLVTRTPFIHWLFKYPQLLKAYFSILDERGENSVWYRRKDEIPLQFEKGYSINGTGATQFQKLIKGNWDIVTDGFKTRKRNKSSFGLAMVNCLKQIPFSRDLFDIAYVLQKH
jgi:ubiquinone/menaquinone biosynthesis C-methylase UbiE